MERRRIECLAYLKESGSKLVLASYPARNRFRDMQNTATEQVIDVQDTVVVIAVSELPKSREWYSRLFGKGPDLEPFPGNVEFKIGGAWVQISKGQVKPSSWSLQLEVRDLARERERLRKHGIASTEIKTVPDVISFFDLSDPDGNSMRWFQVLTADPKVTGNRD
jgi:predicted enzyme related to lactoylglutathione lyase